MIATRRQAREWAIQMLTAADLNPGVEPEQVFADFWAQIPTLDDQDGGTGGVAPKGKLKTFACERAEGVISHLKEIDEKIVAVLVDWDLYRLGTVERAVLRLGMWELLYSEVPPKVVINEAIDLVNWFSSPRSRQIINGVLNQYVNNR